MSPAASLHAPIDAGAGPLVVCLHGVENDGRYWRGVAAALVPGHRILAFDLVGFGGSVAPPGCGFTVDDHLDAVTAALDDRVGGATSVTLVGHSLGAILAAEWAARCPGRVERLVLFSVPLSRPVAGEASGARDRMRAAFAARFGRLRAMGERVAPLAPVAAARSRIDASLASIRAVVEAEDVAGSLDRVGEMPVLVAHGTRDPFVVGSRVAALAASRPGVEVVTMQAGHDIAVQAPAEAACLIDPALDFDEARARVRAAVASGTLRLPPLSI